MPPLCDVPAIHNPGLVVHCAFVSICLRVRSCVASPLRVITLILPLYCCGILHYAVHVMFSATRVFVFAIRAFLFIPHSANAHAMLQNSVKRVAVVIRNCVICNKVTVFPQPYAALLLNFLDTTATAPCRSSPIPSFTRFAPDHCCRRLADNNHSRRHRA